MKIKKHFFLFLSLLVFGASAFAQTEPTRTQIEGSGFFKSGFFETTVENAKFRFQLGKKDKFKKKPSEGQRTVVEIFIENADKQLSLGFNFNGDPKTSKIVLGTEKTFTAPHWFFEDSSSLINGTKKTSAVPLLGETDYSLSFKGKTNFAFAFELPKDNTLPLLDAYFVMKLNDKEYVFHLQ